MLIDHVKIYVKAGDGGNGAVSFHMWCSMWTPGTIPS